jgi:hypothetical protein
MEGTVGLSKRLKDERCWRKFHHGDWCNAIDVRDFIVRNLSHTPAMKRSCRADQAHDSDLEQAGETPC